MKKKIIIAILCFCLVNFGILMKSHFNSNNNDNGVVEDSNTIVSKGDDGEIDSVYKMYKEIIKNYDLSGCNELTGELYFRCKYTILSSLDKLSDIKDCFIFSGTSYYNLCKNYVFYKKFECDKIDNKQLRHRCKNDYYYNKAVKTKNKYWCLYIKKNYIKELCFKKIKQIKDNSIGKSNLFTCQNFVLQRLDYEPSLKRRKKICESLKGNQKLYQKCMDNYYFKKAIERLDIDSCNFIKDSNLKNKCVEDTNYNIAVEYTDVKRCERLNNGRRKQECKDKVMLRIISKDNIKDVNICHKIKMSVYKKQCYEIVLSNM